MLAFMETQKVDGLIMTTKEKFELVINLAQEKLNDINEEEIFELRGKKVSVVDAMESLANVTLFLDYLPVSNEDEQRLKQTKNN